MTKDGVIQKLHRRCNGATSNAQVARDIGVKPSLLSDVMRGRRSPTPQILAALGLERHITYRPIR